VRAPPGRGPGASTPRDPARHLLCLAVATAATACGPSGPDLTRAGDCPHRTAAEWQSFLDGAARSDAWEKTCDDDGCDAAAYDAVEAGVASVFARCADLLADNPPLDACADRLRRFTTSWLSQHDLSSYGFTTDNATYFAAQVAPDVPSGMMSPPTALLSAMPDLEQVIDAARARGWPYVVQASCLGNVRLYVVSPDPAGRFDQWTLMNLRADTSAPVLVHSRVSFLAVQETDAGGVSLPAVRVHFRDLLVQSAPGGAYTATSDAADNAKCYACHPSGPRQLLAMRTPALAARPVLGEPGFPGDGPADFPFQRLTAMNARIAAYGLNDYGGQIEVADHGPALGGEEGCTACHDGARRGVLTVSTSRKQLAHKVQAELAMPPTPDLPRLLERQTMNDPPLTTAEATTLADAEAAHASLLADLLSTRAPALERWLLEARCE
jgi:hypothetical protein